MGKQAREIQNRILENLPKNKRLFPINSGMGWVGKIVRRDAKIIILENPRPLHAAPNGWPDLCGFETITITQEMVGQKIAVFCAEEIKAGDDKLQPAQRKFRDLFIKMGARWRVITE